MNVKLIIVVLIIGCIYELGTKFIDLCFSYCNNKLDKKTIKVLNDKIDAQDNLIEALNEKINAQNNLINSQNELITTLKGNIHYEKN